MNAFPTTQPDFKGILRPLRPLSEVSQQKYAYWVGRFTDWLEGQEPTLELAEAYMSEMRAQGKQENTLSFIARALRREYGFPLSVPAVRLKEPNYLEVEDVRRLIAAASTTLERTILTVLFSSGARIMEILNLELPDLELDKGVATVTRKGGRRERMNLGPQGTQALKDWLAARKANDRRVFMDHDYNSIYYRLKRVAKAAGIPFHPHMLRHSRVVHLLDSKVPLERVSQIVGHTSIRTTATIYGRLKAEKLAEFMVEF